MEEDEGRESESPAEALRSRDPAGTHPLHVGAVALIS